MTDNNLNNIDTLKPTLELIAKLLTNTQSINPSDYHIGEYCIVRTYSAGVFFAQIKKVISLDFQGITLSIANSRLIHSWSGAKTVLDIANNGLEGANLSSVFCPEHTVIGAIDIFPCSEKTKKQFLNLSKEECKF